MLAVPRPILHNPRSTPIMRRYDEVKGTSARIFPDGKVKQDGHVYVYSTSWRVAVPPFCFYPWTTVAPINRDFSKAISFRWNRSDRNALGLWLHGHVVRVVRQWGLQPLYKLSLLSFVNGKGHAALVMKTHLVALLLGLTMFVAMAQSPPQAKNEKPRPEIQRVFDTFLGAWSVTEKIERSETVPNGGTGEGEEVYKRGPGGSSFIWEIHLKEESRNLSGLGVGWWDQQAKGYRMIWCSSENRDGCIAMAHPAQWEGNDFVLADEFDRDGKKFVFKEVFSEITPTSFTQTLYQGEAGKELKKLLTIHATKRK
jgi:hypothetical protein